MFKNTNLFIVYFICVAFVSCNIAGVEKTKLTLVPISDTLYKPNNDYQQTVLLWKNYYEQCINGKLFPDAFYLQLQSKLYIGSINNEHEIDVNKGIHILDTSNYRNIFNLLAVVNSGNCHDTFSLNNHLKKDFYDEVVAVLNASSEYKNLVSVLDATQMKIKIGSVYSTELRTDSLVDLLNRTQDSALIRFKELLLKPENALLGQTVEMVGFSAEFPLSSKLSAAQEKGLTKEVFFDINNSNENAGIMLLSNNNLHIQINKRYTVLGRFLKLKAE